MTPTAAPDQDLTPAEPGHGTLAPAEAAAVARYRRSADAAETIRGYRRDWQAFSEWCIARHATALPAAPATVGAHLAALADAGRALATLRRRLAAIARAHRSAGHRLDAGHPAIRETLRGIARSIGRPQRRAAALCTAELKAIAIACAAPQAGEADPFTVLAALRDRALLLFGYAAALRRGELAALQIEHLTFSPGGARLLLPRSKADIEGAGETIFIARGSSAASCPVGALEAWLQAARLGNGPVWRAINRGSRSGGSQNGGSGPAAPHRRARPHRPGARPVGGGDPPHPPPPRRGRWRHRHGTRADQPAWPARRLRHRGLPRRRVGRGDHGPYAAPRPGLDAPLRPPRPARGRYADPQARTLAGRHGSSDNAGFRNGLAL